MPARSRSMLEPCDEVYHLGGFAWECEGHIPGAERRAVRLHGGLLEHRSWSPQAEGDVELSWWTQAHGGTSGRLDDSSPVTEPPGSAEHQEA